MSVAKGMITDPRYERLYAALKGNAAALERATEDYWSTAYELIAEFEFDRDSFEYTLATALMQKVFDWTIASASLGGSMRGLTAKRATTGAL